MAERLTLRNWLDERRQNALTIAASRGVSDPAAWREDADYFRRAVEAIDSRDTLRTLWLEWLDGMYDSRDLLRRVKLAVHGQLRKPGNAGVLASDRADDDAPCIVCGKEVCAGHPIPSGVPAAPTPAEKDPDLCREPGCNKPPISPVHAWCKEHDRRGGVPYA